MIWLLLALCTGPACSDDPGQPCNQVLAWDHDGTAERFEIRAVDSPAVCLTVDGSARSADLTATACLSTRDNQHFEIRACNGGACTDWTGDVEIWPTSCLEGDGSCERPCCPGSALYLPERYPPCP